MKNLKTILMWYSGVILGIFTLFSIPYSIESEVTCTLSSVTESIVFLLFLIPIVFYVFWEIADSLKSKK